MPAPVPPAASSGAPPEVTVCIVAYDSGAFLQPCVDALAGQSFADFACVIADNASRDGSVETLHLPDLRFAVRGMGANLGFAAANNRVAEDAASPFFVLLNPDTIADPAWLQALVVKARAVPKAASVGSLQVSLDDHGKLDGVGDVWHVAGLAWRAGEGWNAERAPGDGEIMGPCGAAALYRREVFLEHGGFDERFFCYCEDVDLALRLRLAGWRSVRASAAVVRHAGSGISGRRSEFTLYHGHRNRVWTFLKNTPGPWLWLLLPYHLAWNALYLVTAARAGFGLPIWRAFRDAWRGRAPFLAARRAAKGDYRRVLEVASWTPWAPFRRELKPDTISAAAAPVDKPAPPPPLRDAFGFTSPLGLGEMKTRLDAATDWTWREGDSAYFDYLAARVGPGARDLRLYPESGRYVLGIRRGACDPSLEALIRERVLPAVEAEDVRMTEGFD